MRGRPGPRTARGPPPSVTGPCSPVHPCERAKAGFAATGSGSPVHQPQGMNHGVGSAGPAVRAMGRRLLLRRRRSGRIAAADRCPCPRRDRRGDSPWSDPGPRPFPVARLSAWAPFLVMGLPNNAVPFSVLNAGRTMVSAGPASIINGMRPLFTALVMASFREERLTMHRAAGVLPGVVVLIGRPDADMADARLPGIGLCLAATLSCGCAALWGRRHLADVPQLASATCQLLSSTLVMTLVAASVDRPWTLPMPGTEVWIALCGLGMFGTAIAYGVFFEILTRAGASTVMLVTLLIPVTALLLGNMFPAEPILLYRLGGCGNNRRGAAVYRWPVAPPGNAAHFRVTDHLRKTQIALASPGDRTIANKVTGLEHYAPEVVSLPRSGKPGGVTRTRVMIGLDGVCSLPSPSLPTSSTHRPLPRRRISHGWSKTIHGFRGVPQPTTMYEVSTQGSRKVHDVMTSIFPHMRKNCEILYLHDIRAALGAQPVNRNKG